MINIGVSIKEPSDIPKAQNACINNAFELGADHVVYIHGDQYLTEAGDEYIKDVINTMQDEAHCCISSMNVNLYTNMWRHYWQLSISSKMHKIEYSIKADGEEAVHKWPICTDRLDLLLDIGYIGTEAYYKHLRNLIHLSKRPDAHYDYKLQWIKLYERGHLEDAVKLAYKAIKSVKRVDLEPINIELYKNLLDKINLWDDYAFCAKVRQSL